MLRCCQCGKEAFLIKGKCCECNLEDHEIYNSFMSSIEQISYKFEKETGKLPLEDWGEFENFARGYLNK